jgi:hypothetical protein
MAEATIIGEVDVHSPGVEVVKLTASDAETYTSRKFANIGAAIATLNVASAGLTDEVVSVTVSGAVATIELVGTDTTDLAITLVLYGNLGN